LAFKALFKRKQYVVTTEAISSENERPFPNFDEYAFQLSSPLPDKICLFVKTGINNTDVHLGFSLIYSIS